MEKLTYNADAADDPMTQTAIRMPESYFNGLKEIAEAEDRKVSSVLRHAIRLYLEAYEEAHK